MVQNLLGREWRNTTYFPFGNLKLGLNGAGHGQGRIDAPFNRKLGTNRGNARDLEGGARKGNVKNNALFLIKDLRHSLEAYNARDLALIVKGKIALAYVEWQAERVDNECEAKAGLDLDIEKRLRKQVSFIADISLGALPRLINELGCDSVVVRVYKLALDLWLDKLRKPLQDTLTKPALVQLTLAQRAKVIVVPELFLEPPYVVVPHVGECTPVNAPLLLGHGTGNDSVPIVILVAEINPHLCSSKVSRNTTKVVVKSQRVHHRLPGREVGEAAWQQLGMVINALNGLHALCDGVLSRPAPRGHLQDGAGDAVTEPKLVAVAVLGEVGADHADCVFALGDRVITPPDVPV